MKSPQKSTLTPPKGRAWPSGACFQGSTLGLAVRTRRSTWARSRALTMPISSMMSQRQKAMRRAASGVVGPSSACLRALMPQALCRVLPRMSVALVAWTDLEVDALQVVQQLLEELGTSRSRIL